MISLLETLKNSESLFRLLEPQVLESVLEELKKEWLEQAQKEEQCVENGDGTITDIHTGLMWQKDADGTKRTYDEALLYCRELRLASYSDWRLPTLKELLSIVVRDMPANINKTFTNAKPERYWTITEFAQYKNGKYLGNEIAYTVDFADGIETSYYKNYKYYVRAVRGKSDMR